ncbi:DUF3810 family protein [Lewinella cohaerens]|uniref:DUF3810 family protein n=1 Tax=Lewinella cohaerens TaxID=70995 RepID=UPI00037AA222|nr:DUF3810 family protein [Lewinella cohaerens]
MHRKGFVRWGIVLAALALVIRAVASPEWVEQYYSRGFFSLFRMFWDTMITSWFPFAVLYLLFFVLLLRFIRAIIRWRKLKGIQRLWSALLGLLGFSGWLVFTFLLLWGFNYGRVSVENKLGFELSTPSRSDMQAQVTVEAAALVELRRQIPGADTMALSTGHFPENREDLLRESLEQVLTYYNYPVIGSVRGRLVYPKGLFLRFSSAGLYLPWTGEGHIDGGLLALQQPYTMAHEMAHGYGFGDEGSCSFWAYLTAFRITDPALKYAIRLGYWRRLASGWRRVDPESYSQFRATLDKGLVADLEAINENNAAYPDIMPKFRDAAYDSYLKAQGIAEGMENYSKVILLVEAWRKDADAFLQSN